MAREIEVIHQAIIDDLVTKAAEAGELIYPDEWSDFDYRQLLTFVTAVAGGKSEQLWDAFMEDVEGKISAASPQTAAWVQAQMYKFQFDATTPQILQFDDSEGIDSTFAPYYPVPNANMQVIKYCSVVPYVYGIYRVLVAAQVNGYPADLEATYPGALAAANTYCKLLNVPGMEVVAVTGNSDKLYLEGDLYYDGGYSAVIENTVPAAIEAYLESIPFSGVMILSNLELAIKAVPGVIDYVPKNVRARPDATAFGGGTSLVIASKTVNRKYAAVAGYIVGETTAGNTLVDSLNFIAE